ncbi:MAG: benzoate-CoA ligase family protein [Thermodesulfobacteriota bacterium]
MDMSSVPEGFNVGVHLLDRHLQEGRGNKIAIYFQDETYTYAQLLELANQAGNALLDLGLERENRVLICLPDSPWFMGIYFGAMRIGAVPVPVNTMASWREYVYYLNDSRAKVLVTTSRIWDVISEHKDDLKFLGAKVLVDDQRPDCHHLSTLLEAASAKLTPVETSRNDMAFWLYSSGTTGTPKGVIHLHHDLPYFMSPLCEQVLNLSTEDVVFSTSKMFFSYGRNNSLDSVFLTGTSVVLSPERPSPENILPVLKKYRPTILYSVPSSYAAILRYMDQQEIEPDLSFLRMCLSAGEALPLVVFEHWKKKFGLEIINGVGSSDVGAIYMSNQPGQVQPGSSGRILSGFEARLLDDGSQEVPKGETGTLWIKNKGTTPGYWNKHTKTQQVICHDWFCTGDRFFEDDQGNYHYAGREDDMLKPGGIWMSPLEVEDILLRHPAVDECGIVGFRDVNNLEKPLAFVVLSKSYAPSDDLAHELKEHVKSYTAHYKYPRWIKFVDELPRTATGKLQRYRLRLLIDYGGQI